MRRYVIQYKIVALKFTLNFTY